MHILERHATHAFLRHLEAEVAWDGESKNRARTSNEIYIRTTHCARRLGGKMDLWKVWLKLCLGCLWHFLWPCCIDSPTRFSICIEHEIELGRGGVNRA